MTVDFDSQRLVGSANSLALDQSGYPHISYSDGTSDNLKYAYYDPSGWHIDTVDSEGNVGAFTSLELDENGDSHISYYDHTNGDLKYALRFVRPDLTLSAKMASSRPVEPGDRVAYTIRLANRSPLSATFSLVDPIPWHTTYVPESARSSGGEIAYTDAISWTGMITGSTNLTATFAVSVDATLTQPTAIVNLATLTGDPTGPLTLQAVVIVNGYHWYLPIICRAE